MRREKKLKLRPHYGWIGGIFVIAGVVAAMSWPRSVESYAYSAEDEWRTMDDITYMQEMTAKICENTPKYADVGLVEYDLIDNRGASPITYKVAKLADENCWMTQNLRLPGGTTISTADSDLHQGSFVANSSSTTASSGTTYTLKASSTNGFSSNTDLDMYNGTDNDYGAYYTWCAATAGCLTAESKNPGANEEAGSSICPLNWKLPSGGANGQFQKLYDSDTVSNNKWIEDGGLDGNKKGWALGGGFFPATGGYDNNFAFSTGVNGFYWSRTANDTAGGYGLYFGSGSVQPQSDVFRRRGYSVRCVADTEDPEVYPEIPNDPNANRDSATASFSIEVKDAITVAGVEFTDAEGKAVILSAMPGELVDGKINVTVGSNVKYKINLAAEEPDLTSAAGGETHKIPAILRTMTAEELKTNYGWGVMKVGEDKYTGLNATGETFYASDVPAGASTLTQFDVGVSVPPTLPADTYSTEVTVTAIATE